jgi:hypothetical protein
MHLLRPELIFALGIMCRLRRLFRSSDVDVCDAFLMKILAGCPPLSPAEVRQLESWWVAERSPDEGLTAFLIRKGVFRQEALKTVDFMRRGYVTFSDARHLFAQCGVDKARDRVERSSRCTGLISSWSSSVPPLPATAAPANQECLVKTERKPVVQRVAVAQSYRTLPRLAPSQRHLELKPGMMLGKCLLTAEVGRGGSGVVFRAYHQGLNIPVAVKILQVDCVPLDGAIGEQLRQEARLLALLNHPHIVRVLDFDDDGALPYLILEYVEGLSLSELIRQSGRIRWDRAARVIRQVAQALEAAQRLGIVHRDVKPGNILITRDGSAKLADLGLAMVVGKRMCGSGAGDSMAGTVAYMPPEQALPAGTVDHRSDIYALGATFYHAVTGQIPFLGRTRSEVVQMHAQHAPTPPTALVPDLDPRVSSLILKMMAKNPADRCQDHAELNLALAQLESLSGPWMVLPSAGSSIEGTQSGGVERGSKLRTLWRSLIRRFQAP